MHTGGCNCIANMAGWLLTHHCTASHTYLTPSELACSAAHQDMLRGVPSTFTVRNQQHALSTAQVTAHPLLAELALRPQGGAMEAVAMLAPSGRAALGFLWHHRMRGRALMPGAAMCEMAAAACQVRGRGACVTPKETPMTDVLKCACRGVGDACDCTCHGMNRAHRSCMCGSAMFSLHPVKANSCTAGDGWQRGLE